MHYENKFYEILENLFIGKEIQGKSGIANIMRIKSQFFFKLKDELKALTSPMEATFKEEIYNKLYGFFHRYFSDCGSIYFSYTPLFYDIYSKEYEGKKASNFEKIKDAQNDVSLFYKTKMLYYIKSDVVLNDLEIKIENINFIFSTKNLNAKMGNEKRKIIYILKKIEENSIFLDVVDSKENLFDEVSDIKSIVKAALSSHKIKENISEELIKKAILAFESQSKVDFFINKNAKAFLEEQLDLYIYQYLFKQELELNLERFNQIQFIKKLALIIINFISQFENELSKIWNKKRFVLKSNIIVSLFELKEAGFDIEKLKQCKKYKNQKQEWETLGLLDSSFSLIEDLYLQIDTKYFEELKNEIEERIIDFRKKGGGGNLERNEDFRPSFLDSNNALDSILDSNERKNLDFNGLFIKAENYEALNSLLPRFENKIKVIYIDPPYNTGGDDFMYIDKFKSSSYLSFMANRLELAREFLRDDGVIFVSIDDREMAYLKVLMDEIFGEENFLGCLIWLKGNTQNDAKNLQKNHEYIIAFAKNINFDSTYEVQKNEIVKAYQCEITKKFYYEGYGLSSGSAEGGRLENRPNLGYSIYYNPKNKDFIGVMDYDKEEAKNPKNHKNLYKNNDDLIAKGYEIIRPPKMGAGLGRWKILIKIKKKF